MLQIHDSQGSKMRYHFRIYMIMLAWLSRWGWLYFAMINWEVGNHAHFLESPDSGDHFLCIYTVFDVFLGENHVCVYIYIYRVPSHTHTHKQYFGGKLHTNTHNAFLAMFFIYQPYDTSESQSTDCSGPKEFFEAAAGKKWTLPCAACCSAQVGTVKKRYF